MANFLEERIKRNYTPDGIMKLEYREKLSSKGFSEVEINHLEQTHIREAAIDRELAEWQQELERQRVEDNAQEEEERRQRAESLGIPYEPLPVSIGINYNRQHRAEEMAGLDREELLSQGFLEADDFYDPSDESINSSDSESKSQEAYFDPNWEPDGGWVDF